MKPSAGADHVDGVHDTGWARQYLMRDVSNQQHSRYALMRMRRDAPAAEPPPERRELGPEQAFLRRTHSNQPGPRAGLHRSAHDLVSLRRVTAQCTRFLPAHRRRRAPRPLDTYYR